MCGQRLSKAKACPSDQHNNNGPPFPDTTTMPLACKSAKEAARKYPSNWVECIGGLIKIWLYKTPIN